MLKETPSSADTNLPEEFQTQVKQVLERFYDFPYLSNHPLAKAIQLERVRPSETDGQRLRRIFLAAIEDIKPVEEAVQTHGSSAILQFTQFALHRSEHHAAGGF